MAKPSTSALNREAADWFVRLQRPDLPGEERQAFEAWIDGDPAHAVAFARVEQTWERGERLRAAPPAATATVVEVPVPASRRWFTRRAAVAGIAAGIAGAAGFWTLGSLPETHRTDVGERRSIRLVDGSTVHLNTATRLDVAYRDGEREVRLESGEALFQVAHDAARPFVVRAGDTAVRAIGTAFNVRLRGSLVEVTVTDGIVEIDDGRAGRRRVPAGAGAIAGANEIAQIALDPAVMHQRTAWRNGLIELNGQTLEQAVSEFNRYRRTPIVIGDPRVAAIRVGGTFEIDESEIFLSALRDGFNVRAIRSEGGAVYLMPGA